MLSLCKHGHQKTKDNLISKTKCKFCRYRKQYESRQKLLFERSFIINIFKAVPCHDCRLMFPSYVMDFDHVKGRKYRALSVMAEHNSLKRILAEIKKCQVVCSNCHRERTFKRYSFL